MTSFSDAIANGFAIAARLREQDESERKNRADEDYRSSVFSENRRQFDLGLADRQATRKQQNEQFGQKLQLERDALTSADEYRKGSLRQGDRRLDLADRAMRDEIDRKDRAEEDAFVGQVSETVFARERSGKPFTEAEILQLYAGNPIGRRIMNRGGLPTESVRDGTTFDTAVEGPNGEVTVAGKREDGTTAIPDVGRTPDNRTPPFKMAPGNVTSLHTGATMYYPAGMAAARRHAALTSNLDEAALTDAQIEAELKASNDRAWAQHEAALKAQAQAQANAPTLDQAPSSPPSALSNMARQDRQLMDEATAEVGQGFNQGRPGLVLRGALAGGLNYVTRPLRAAGAAFTDATNSQFVTDTFGLDAPPPPQQPATPPAPQPPGPITELDANHPLMRKRARLQQEQQRLQEYDRASQMGLTPEQAGAWITTQQPSPSIAVEALRQDRAAAEGAAAVEAENAKRLANGYKYLDESIGRLNTDEYTRDLTGPMRELAREANAMTGGQLGANPQLADVFTTQLKNVFLNTQEDDDLNTPEGKSVRAAIALKATLATPRSALDANDPKQLEYVSEALMKMYRSPGGLSQKQALVAADILASDLPEDEKEAQLDALRNADRGQVERLYQQTFNNR